MSFALFGVGGVLLRVLVFPVLGLLPGDVLQRRTRARAVVSWTFRVFVQFMFRTGVLTYEVEGAERLGRPGQMVIANHPSLIDVVVLIAFIRDANCVVKQSLWENPCMRGPIRAAQYISNSGSMDMLD
ncbi:MAG: 1-acyl-sn-glycerol-3-phosphate acyltransferase, partial [Pseudomonas sp.]|nr:1-acyl-sn-glycerol-3-phosphate acyltransferase [Pseudomonas sp.]